MAREPKARQFRAFNHRMIWKDTAYDWVQEDVEIIQRDAEDLPMNELFDIAAKWAFLNGKWNVQYLNEYGKVIFEISFGTLYAELQETT